MGYDALFARKVAPAPALGVAPAARELTVQREVLLQHIRSQLDVIYILPVVLLTAGLVLITVTPVLPVAAWFLCCVGLLIANQLFYQDVLGRPDVELDPGYLERQITVRNACYGVAQASVAVWALPTGTVEIDVFVIVLTVGSLMAAAALATATIRIYLALALPFSLGSIYGLLASGGLGFAALAFILLFATALTMRVAQRAGATARRFVELHFDLMEARDGAERASLAKSRFIAAMSHELRTPLNAILGFSEMISTQALGPVGSAKYLEYASDIHVSGRHLLSLINDVLDLAKIEAGKSELNLTWIAADAVLESCMRVVGPKAQEKGLTLRQAEPAGSMQFHADERAVRQVLLNVLSNAVKFTPIGGQITLSIERCVDEAVVFRIRDTGPGIAGEEIQRIFEPFEQGDNGFGRNHGGTGLGLTLVRSLMKLHGGEVELESRLGCGTTVHLRFPQSPASAAQRASRSRQS